MSERVSFVPVVFGAFIECFALFSSSTPESPLAAEGELEETVRANCQAA